MKRQIDLQLFASFDEVITANEKAFEGSNVKEQFSTLSTKLNELGYDVLINNKKQAEFVPSSRLSEVVGQRDTFKSKVEEINVQLETFKKGAGDNEALKAEYTKLIEQNNGLLKELEQTKVNTEIMMSAKDAVNAKDLLMFVNMANIKVNAKGEVLGADAEIARLRTEKSYLFMGEANKRKGGTDNKDDKGDKVASSMNAQIRKAAGRL